MGRFFNIQDGPEYLCEGMTTLYERKPVTGIWNKLTQVAKLQWKWKNVADKKGWRRREKICRILQIHGPPGSGKSSAVFHWVCQVCKSLNTEAIWIRCADAGGQSWKIGSTQVTESAVPQSTADVAKFPTVVFDGVRASTLETWRGMMNDLARRGVFVIVVSSEGVTFHAGDSQDILKLEYFVPSWVIDEYTEACKDDNFWTQNCFYFADGSEDYVESRRLELLRAKFPVAGHSARFMFHQTSKETSRELSAKARSMQGIDSLERAVRADRSAGAINTLIARLENSKNGTTPLQRAIYPTVQDLQACAANRRDLFETQHDYEMEQNVARLVSAMATAEIIKEIPTDVQRLRALARALDNRAIEGYALEEQVKKKLREASQPGHIFSLRSDNGQVRRLQVSTLIECSSPEEVELVLKSDLQPDSWIFVAGRQGAFDVVHVISSGQPGNSRVRFIQLTAGQTHSFKLHLIDGLMQKLAMQNPPKTWSHLEFMILRPVDDSRPFQLGTANGGLQSYMRFDGTSWDRTDYRNNVTYARMGWEY